MAKFRVNADGSLLKVNSKLTFGEKINERELNILESQLFRGCFRPKWDGKKRIIYTAPAAIALKKYLEQSLTEPAFYELVGQILEMTKQIEGAGLYLPNLLLNIDYIFVNERTKELFFVYQPIVSKDVGENVNAFIKELVRRFEKKNGTLVAFEEKLKNMLENPPSRKVAVADAYANHSRQQQGGDLATTLLAGGSEETTLLCGEETTLLREEKFPSIRRMRTGEIVAVKGTSFKIGKSGTCDFVIAENKVISRNHAIIEKKNGNYYLIDQNSTNHSYVNNKLSEPGKEEALQYGDMIRLADEDFCFEE